MSREPEDTATVHLKSVQRMSSAYLSRYENKMAVQNNEKK